MKVSDISIITHNRLSVIEEVCSAKTAAMACSNIFLRAKIAVWGSVIVVERRE